jgi:hypothetical protein
MEKVMAIWDLEAEKRKVREEKRRENEFNLRLRYFGNAF